MTPKEKIAIDQMTRVAESQGWSVTAVDTRTESVDLTISKHKSTIEGGK